MYFLGLSGPAGTGKTTLLNAIQKPLCDYAAHKGFQVVFQAERARILFHEEFADRYDTFNDLMKTDPLAFQLRLSEIFVQEVCAARDPDTLIIADRTGFDVLVYTLLATQRGFLDTAKVGLIFKNLEKTILKVDKMFMTRSLPTVEEDGFRPECYAGAIRALEENLFNVLSVPHHPTWLPPNHEERVALVLATVRGLYY